MSEWISVEDRLPDNKKPEAFLVRQWYRDAEARKKYGHERLIVLRWKNPGDDKFLGESAHNPVTHWQPLPPPPEENSK